MDVSSSLTFWPALTCISRSWTVDISRCDWGDAMVLWTEQTIHWWRVCYLQYLQSLLFFHFQLFHRPRQANERRNSCKTLYFWAPSRQQRGRSRNKLSHSKLICYFHSHVASKWKKGQNQQNKEEIHMYVQKSKMLFWALHFHFAHLPHFVMIISVPILWKSSQSSLLSSFTSTPGRVNLGGIGGSCCRVGKIDEYGSETQEKEREQSKNKIKIGVIISFNLDRLMRLRLVNNGFN